jgi:hypothetical protein
MRYAWPFLFLTIAFPAPLNAASVYDAPAPAGNAEVFSSRRASPHGTVEVAFEPPPDMVPADPDKPDPTAGVRHRLYQVAFYPPGSNTALALAPFNDVYGSSDTPKPSTFDQLFKQLHWSPDEDFVILPRERWPAGYPSAPRQAVSLNKKFPWQIMPFPLEEEPIVWADPLHAIGNRHDGCRWDVVEFDGPSGKTTSVAPGSDVDGYKILEVREKQILMKKYRSECAPKSAGGSFQSDCITMNLSFMRLEAAACP